MKDPGRNSIVSMIEYGKSEWERQKISLGRSCWFVIKKEKRLPNLY